MESGQGSRQLGRTTRHFAVLALAALGGCSGGETAALPGVSAYDPIELPPLAAAPLTDTQTLAPVHAPLAVPDERKPSVPQSRQQMLDEGYGETLLGSGAAHASRTTDGQPPPAAGASPRRLVRFAHLTDLHVVDDESPARLANFDAPGMTSGAFRPQDVDQCRILNAMVRSLNVVHLDTPLSFVLVGGDAIDSAQTNELDWLLSILGGAERVDCDSGADDDPVPGAGNDGKDPFVAEGLAVPWYWAMGNHDLLRQGNVPITDSIVRLATGDESNGGTRDWSLPGGPLGYGPFPTDARREPLSPSQLIERVAADGDGHGLAGVDGSGGEATYGFDVEGTSLRFVVIDTAAQTGGADGVLHRADLEAVVLPALDRALADGRWVVLLSHHAAGSLSLGDGLGGELQPDAVLADEWLAALGDYPNVLFSFVGHSHEHRVSLMSAGPTHRYWEVMTSSLADYPHQGRVVELWDEDNGWVRLRSTNVDYAVDGDEVAAEGRALGTLDYVAGWASSGSGSPEDGNVDLWIPSPP